MWMTIWRVTRMSYVDDNMESNADVICHMSNADFICG